MLAINRKGTEKALETYCKINGYTETDCDIINLITNLLLLADDLGIKGTLTNATKHYRENKTKRG